MTKRARANGLPSARTLAWAVALPVLGAATLLCPSAGAQQPAPSPVADAPPRAHRGFQLAGRLGVALPTGKLMKQRPQSDTFGPQLAVTFDVGAKVIEQLFVGAYVGFAVGGGGSDVRDTCHAKNLVCGASTLRVGVEAQLHLLPPARLNPWVGYGVGLEVSSISENGSGENVARTVKGAELAHLMAGLDVRVSPTFGVGPFVDLGLGQYASDAYPSPTRDIEAKALHGWLVLGARLVLFP